MKRLSIDCSLLVGQSNGSVKRTSKGLVAATMQCPGRVNHPVTVVVDLIGGKARSARDCRLLIISESSIRKMSV